MLGFCYDSGKNYGARLGFAFVCIATVGSILMMVYSMIYSSFAVDSIQGGGVFQRYQEAWDTPFLFYAFWRSFLVIGAAFLTMVVLALMIGRAIFFFSKTWQIFLGVLFAAPVFFPSLVSAHAVLQMLAHFDIYVMHSRHVELLMYVGYVFVYFPYVILLIVPAFLQISPIYIDAARDLGGSEVALWRRIFLPLMRINIGIAALNVIPTMFFDITIPEMFACENAASFAHYLWVMFLDFGDWSILGVVVAVMCAFVLLLFAIKCVVRYARH